MKSIKIPKVISIQVGGEKVVGSLEEACWEYHNTPRPKINFTIEDKNGKTRSITIRDDEDLGTVAYGDFDGLIDFLEYSKIVVGKAVGE